jgi:ABC-2 type transport system ATP-binding protein
VIFLDEPTTGLDPASRHELWALIDGLVAGGTTVLLTTQYLEEADRLADMVAVIDRGRMLATGTPEDLKARLGGDTLRIHLADPTDLQAAATVLGGHGAVTAEPEQATLELRVPAGATVLPEALRRLDGVGLTVSSAEIRRPSLDDVFLALTGRHPPPADGDERHAARSRRAHHHGTRSHP